MKASAQVGVVFLLALFNLGAALKCYNCPVATDNCTVTKDCAEDTCLKLAGQGGKNYYTCVAYSKCSSSELAILYPSLPSISYKCCQTNLCNSAPEITAKSSLMGLSFSLVLFFWCIL